MAPIFAQKCGFVNPRQHKAHGKHALGITMLANSTVSEHVKLRLSKHSDLKTHERYQYLTEESVVKKYKAMNPSLCTSSPTKIPPPPQKIKNAEYNRTVQNSTIFTHCIHAYLPYTTADSD